MEVFKPFVIPGEKPTEGEQPGDQTQTLNWTEVFSVTDAEVEAFRDPDWAYPDLIIESHVVSIVADPGAGKTTICTSICGDLVQRGYQIFYVLADIGQSDVRHYHEMSKAGGWSLLLPDIKAGKSMNDVVDHLAEMNDAGGDFSGVIFFFDTLKKMVDVIDKRRTKALLGMLRQLTAKGMTIVLIGHTNKYKDENGDPIFEGTHDIKTDSDELIYLIPKEQHDGTILASTKVGKARGQFEPITFQIDSDRTVRLLNEYVNTAVMVEAEKQHEDDSDLIEVIVQIIRGGTFNQTKIVEACREHHIARKTVRRVLRDYSTGPFQQWRAEKGMERNAWLYYLTEANK